MIATAVPLATLLMLRELEPPPERRVIKTVGAVPPVSKTNPLGAFRIIVPAPASPFACSE